MHYLKLTYPMRSFYFNLLFKITMTDITWIELEGQKGRVDPSSNPIIRYINKTPKCLSRVNFGYKR